METISRHLLAELWGCDSGLLNSPERLEPILRRAALAAGATPVECVFHRYAPHGVSGVLLVSESHVSIHTWPEAGYAAVDMFTCGDCDPPRGFDALRVALGADRCEVMEVSRGGIGARSMQVVSHHE